jgi:hypothetical protein
VSPMPGTADCGREPRLVCDTELRGTSRERPSKRPPRDDGFRRRVQRRDPGPTGTTGHPQPYSPSIAATTKRCASGSADPSVAGLFRELFQVVFKRFAGFAAQRQRRPPLIEVLPAPHGRGEPPGKASPSRATTGRGRPACHQARERERGNAGSREPNPAITGLVTFRPRLTRLGRSEGTLYRSPPRPTVPSVSHLGRFVRQRNARPTSA